jgi:protein-L-isoaspartate(D-aspartate) O-methyltransferase
VARHEFVPPAYLASAYDDRPLPIGESETISQPYIVAAMSVAARVQPGDKALEVGTGTGYQAAILVYLGATVYTVERNPQLAESARERLARLGYKGIEVICGDGTEGYSAAAPYQVIVVTAAAPLVPPPLLDHGDPRRRPPAPRPPTDLQTRQRSSHAAPRPLPVCSLDWKTRLARKTGPFLVTGECPWARGITFDRREGLPGLSIASRLCPSSLESLLTIPA